ncbi:DnaB-like helicase N-terminal domain-containing protein [Actinacidiphila sp. DG2A-62]|uniref:DnaB-like helicase N-terminal domain-containing protein n=1 Tax=Actinacidiphila sp. DG2A-62 TaxID=3108821 RepID=UPI002DB8C3E6|nr:DnaB-like helicase N-terminal domain-containing protein [Actinacidiphila sp. DG2A-62]MEC3997135.1 DnaB-like helicase N-terminal domain-containing protein [Actinacidiphila sp. DG2A-62]
MIRAEAFRRDLREHAIRLAQTAGDISHPDPAAAVVDEAGRLLAFLDRNQPHWPHRSGPVPRAEPVAPPVGQPSRETLDEEQLLLAAVTARPEDHATLRGLRPQDFNSALHGRVFAALDLMIRRGALIDPVTVLWQVWQDGALGESDPADLLAVLQRPAGPADHWARRIHQRALLTAAKTAGHHITTLTGDPTRAPHHLILGARRALSELAQVTRRRAPPPADPPPAPRPPALAARRNTAPAGRAPAPALTRNT